MKYDRTIPVEEYFSYHPVVSNQRQIAHNQINKAALQFAQVVWEYLPEDDKDVDIFLAQIQFIRMMLNQAVTVDEVRRLMSEG